MLTPASKWWAVIPWNDRKDYQIPQLFKSVKKVNPKRWTSLITHEVCLGPSIIGFQSVVEVVRHTHNLQITHSATRVSVTVSRAGPAAVCDDQPARDREAMVRGAARFTCLASRGGWQVSQELEAKVDSQGSGSYMSIAISHVLCRA